ncbi:protein kinase domain-containing protein [Streptosporangium soli]|nr:protein kinase [Streptosporangium sp. KLBMP 9127]
MPSFTPLRSGDPTRLGGHDLRGRLGEGGQGVVYLAADNSGTLVAIKWLRPEMSGDPVMVERFVREVAVAERVSPFCTATVLGTGIENDRPYIISEFIDGPSLQAVVTEAGPRTGPSLHRLAIGTSTALAAIHQAGIVHRDFKPANVLLASDGPRVIDFGIARALDATSTISSMPVGTPAYMAPEQILGHTVGPAADLFSWASTMLYAASGNAPFGSDTLPAVINRVLNVQPDLSCLDGSLLDLVAACLNKDPAQRPTAEQVILGLLQHPVSAPGILKEAAAAASEQPGHTKILPNGPDQPSYPAAQGPPSFPAAPGQQPYPGSQGQPSYPGNQGQPSYPAQGQPSYPGNQGQPSYPGPGATPYGPAGSASPQPGPYGRQDQQYGRQQHQAPAPYGLQQAPPNAPGYGGYPPQQGPPTQAGGGSKRGALIAAIVGGVLAVALAVTLVVVLNNRPAEPDPNPTGTLAQSTAPASPTPTPTPTPAPVSTSDLTETALPGGGDVTLFEHPADPITLTSYQVQDAKTKEWVDYARGSLTGQFSKYPNNWESKVSPNGRYLASRGKNYTSDNYDSVVITDRETGDKTTIKTVKQPLIASVWLWSKDSTQVLLAIEREVGNDEWDTRGFVIATVGQSTTDPVTISDRTVKDSYYGWAPGGDGAVAIATSGETSTLRFYGTDGTEQRSIRGIGKVPDTMDFFSPSGKQFVTDCRGGNASNHCIWDTASGKEVTRYTSECDKVLGWYDERHLFCWEVSGQTDKILVIDHQGQSVRTLLETSDDYQLSAAFTRKPGGIS